MIKPILALCLSVLAGAAAAQAALPVTGPIAATAIDPAAMTEARPAKPGMMEQHMRPHISACRYDDKLYSEGAIFHAGKVALVCIEKQWGVMSFASSDEQAPRNLVWEPVNSPRLATYRRATGLEQNNK